MTGEFHLLGLDDLEELRSDITGGGNSSKIALAGHSDVGGRVDGAEEGVV